MATRFRRVYLAGAMVAVAVIAAPGCYDPHVESGHLRCALTSSACPEGFTCAGDVCVSAGTVAGLGGMGGGTGGAAGGGGAGGATCANPIAALCTPAQASTPCDPVCQTGCPCGQRCEVTGSGLECVAPAGALGLGSICSPETDPCAPGLTCLKEMCGDDLGRCYRFCRPATATDPATTCAEDTVCGTHVLLQDMSDSGQLVCDLGDYPCDPIAQTGCPDPALICYQESPSHVTCDCPTRATPAQVGESCGVYSDCAAGLTCLNLGGSPRCVKLCLASVDCPGSICQPFSTTVGYCQPTN